MDVHVESGVASYFKVVQEKKGEDEEVDDDDGADQCMHCVKRSKTSDRTDVSTDVKAEGLAETLARTSL